MLRDMKELQGYTIQATDGEIGHVHEFYFDDQTWTTRYLVVDTGTWLPGRRVLIAPEALKRPNWMEETLPVTLTKVQIEESPAVGLEEPVSRQVETHLRDYYGWAPYWPMTVTPNPWQSMPPAVPSTGAQEREQQPEYAQTAAADDPHLRSTREVMGYHIQALDGDIGHVQTFLVDDATWRIQYLVVDTRNWLPGKKVVVAVSWIDEVQWPQGKVTIDLTREQIKTGPEYDAATPVSRAYEERLFEHYGRSGYWAS